MCGKLVIILIIIVIIKTILRGLRWLRVTEYAIFFFFFCFWFLFLFFIHQNYEEINDNFAVSEYLKKLHRQKSKWEISVGLEILDNRRSSPGFTMATFTLTNQSQWLNFVSHPNYPADWLTYHFMVQMYHVLESVITRSFYGWSDKHVKV